MSDVRKITTDTNKYIRFKCKRESSIKLNTCTPLFQFFLYWAVCVIRTKRVVEFQYGPYCFIKHSLEVDINIILLATLAGAGQEPRSIPPPSYEILIPIKRQTYRHQSTSQIHGMNPIQKQSSLWPKSRFRYKSGIVTGALLEAPPNDGNRLPVDKASQSTIVEFQVSGSSDYCPHWKWSWWFSSLRREKLEKGLFKQTHLMISTMQCWSR